MGIEEEIKSLEGLGCINYNDRLGFHSVPNGYALMLNADYSHFFYVRFDGKESCIHWNRWAVLRWIKQDANHKKCRKVTI